MDLLGWITGTVDIRIIGADLAASLRSITKAGIELRQVQEEGPLSMLATVRRKDHRALKELLRRRGDQLEYRDKSGLYWLLRRFLSRPILVGGVGLLVVLSLYLPTMILFVEVEGNTTVPDAYIRESVAELGLGFGASRRGIRNEKLKNELLHKIPQLQWAGVNTYGCRAVIRVKEQPKEPVLQEKGSICSIVAVRDGVIRELTVKNGSKMCAVGQAVKAGQVLISGYNDCGICIRGTRAEGEVYAETRHDLSAVLPMKYDHKDKISHIEKKYSLRIGKKQINFSKGSGIYTTSCDKMYSVDYIMLPGGLTLPVALVTETTLYFDTSPIDLEEAAARDLADFVSDRYVTGQMTAGKIEQSRRNASVTEDLYRLSSDYVCVEMIGKTRTEENLLDYGQTN
jgi:similar to stage IV sporulation protein